MVQRLNLPVSNVTQINLRLKGTVSNAARVNSRPQVIVSNAIRINLRSKRNILVPCQAIRYPTPTLSWTHLWRTCIQTGKFTITLIFVQIATILMPRVIS